MKQVFLQRLTEPLSNEELEEKINTSLEHVFNNYSNVIIDIKVIFTGYYHHIMIVFNDD